MAVGRGGQQGVVAIAKAMTQVMRDIGWGSAIKTRLALPVLGRPIIPLTPEIGQISNWHNMT